MENDLDLLPYLVLGFFCGIRPVGELNLLQWSDVDLQGQIVTIRAVSKTRRRRFIRLSENAIAWLEAYRQRGGQCEGPIVTYDEWTLRMRRQQNREAAGITHWLNSVMRHSYCSYWLAMPRTSTGSSYSRDTVRLIQCGDTTTVALLKPKRKSSGQLYRLRPQTTSSE